MKIEDLKIGDMIYCINCGNNTINSPCILEIKEFDRAEIIMCKNKDIIGIGCGVIEYALNRGMAYLL